ncbi:hypothetical protein [Stratiformator vulcanicus]|uniref:Prenyltransferase and squalene oxidase repeat protein n=1 Tax=Stratiformator vulcanicus TaxID=2527980 RepID=A0A517R1L8_9PLAN|nr:hypothetical protein [Stratiformator vulcanicus]QDT37768.1 hypothetical protein Pan189_21500 [Stratiformator vulcanicus]
MRITSPGIRSIGGFIVAFAVFSVCVSCAVPADRTPEIDAAIRRGQDALKRELSDGGGRAGDRSLAALALVKTSVPATDPAVAAVLQNVLSRCRTDYQPSNQYYAAGLEMMLLESIDPKRYRNEMNSILSYLLAGQRAHGAWYYPNQTGGGDTSITQYAALGLWSAGRSGLTVPSTAWSDLARWHVATQFRDGGFAYHPPQGPSKDTMCLAGAGTLALALRQLYPSGGRVKTPKDPMPAPKLFGVLEAVDLDENNSVPTGGGVTGQATISKTDLERSRSAALAWIDRNYTTESTTEWKLYYLYTVERTAAFADRDQFGDVDWYRDGAAHLLASQKPDGTFIGGHRYENEIVGTSFAILFLSKATAKAVGRRDVPTIGGGLLAGGRGLPTDLNEVRVDGSKIETRKSTGPLDDLLSQLERIDTGDAAAVQQAIVEKVRLAEPEKLIGEMDRLVRLANDPRDEVRLTAFWALARSGKIRIAPLLIRGLSDDNADVAIEAHNGLCVLSRRPDGFGLPAGPFAGLDEGAGDRLRAEALRQWQSKSIKAWQDWYRRIQPYDQRDGLFEVDDPTFLTR